MLTTNNEEKRNKIWKMATVVSTVLIVVIVLFFLNRMFTGNPLEGRWQHEDSDLLMNVNSDGTVDIEWPEQYGEADVKVSMKYSIDKDTKTFELAVDDEAVQNAANAYDDAITQEELNSSVNTLAATYDYNIESQVLTLTDREYGEQMVFEKQ